MEDKKLLVEFLGYTAKGDRDMFFATYFDTTSFDILAQAGKKFCDIPEMKYSVYAHNIKTAWAEFDTEKTFNALIKGIKEWKKNYTKC